MRGEPDGYKVFIMAITCVGLVIAFIILLVVLGLTLVQTR